MAGDNEPPANSDLVTACEARFISNTFTSPDNFDLLLVWACPSGIFPPQEKNLDAICKELFSTQTVVSCNTPSGLSLKTPSLEDVPSTS